MKLFFALAILGCFCFPQDMIFNKNTNAKEIKSLFVDIEPNSNIPNPYNNESYLKSWTSVYEEMLLRNGFNVISRDKIDAVINEKKLSMAGPTRNESMYKAGKLVGGDGILFVRVAFLNDSTFREEARLISVKSGKIYFSGSFISNIHENKLNVKHKREDVILQLKKGKD